MLLYDAFNIAQWRRPHSALSVQMGRCGSDPVAEFHIPMHRIYIDDDEPGGSSKLERFEGKS